MMTIQNLNKAGMVATLLLSTIAASMATIQVEVDGKNLNLDVPPAIVAGRTMVPLRGIFESLGAQVNWNAATRTITANKGETDIQLGIGNRRATVNGNDVMLGVPAMIIRGATMVPLRFVGEALGAGVQWVPATQTVLIQTNGQTSVSDSGQSTGNSTQAMTIPDGTVIPVKLNQTMNSKTNRLGDQISATIVSATNGDAELPLGTRISGQVSEIQQMGNGQPGMIGLTFNKVSFPDGSSVNTNASLVSLDEKSVEQTSDGRLVARNKKNNNTLKFIGIGAVGGFVLGKLTHKTLEGTLIGAAAGYLYSEYDKKKSKPTDVNVAAGTQFGIMLNRQLAFTPSAGFASERVSYLNGQQYSDNASLDDISVKTGNRTVDFSDDKPFMEGGVVFVPLAPVLDQANIPYKYNDSLKAVSLDTEQGALQMNIGRTYAMLNGERETMEASAQLRNGVVYVPLHFLALATGRQVVWSSNTRTVAMN